MATLEGFGFSDDSVVLPAAGALLEYARDTQRGATGHLLRLERVDSGKHMVLDRATRSTLELTATQRDGRREGTLLETIDQTLTPISEAAIELIVRKRFPREIEAGGRLPAIDQPDAEMRGYINQYRNDHEALKNATLPTPLFKDKREL